MKFKKILLNFKKNLLLYLAIILIVPFLVNSIAKKKTDYKPNEKITFLIASDFVDGEKLGNGLIDILKKYGIVSLKFYSDSPKYDVDFYTYLNNRSSICDMFILPEKFIDKSFIAYNCYPFKQIDESSPFTYGDNDDKSTYALKLKDKHTEPKNNLDFMDYELDDNYFLLIGKNSYFYESYYNNSGSLLGDVIFYFTNYEKK